MTSPGYTRPLRSCGATTGACPAIGPRGAEAVALNEAGGRIAFAFHARDVHLVMGPVSREAPVPFRVTLDGAPPGAAHGSDVDADGSGVLTYPRMYQLIRQDGPIGDRRFEIAFLERGAQAFCFTFG